ncbi:MAG: ribonuclease HIII [Mycoplasmataceae bacterium]|jgi:ribonuclease HIII|nr:ribonuclease HIII [Mycoplasmataceae bacterium]
MQNFTTILKSNEIDKIHYLLKQYQVVKPDNPYLLYFYKVNNLTISIFTSKKILVQGQGAKNFYEKLINQKKTTPNNHTNVKITDYIGCDEVGVGDYFGGLVTCAVYLKKSNENKLNQIGVCDSKKLNDAQMVHIFPKLHTVCEYECGILLPHEYNQLVKRFKNTHIVKSYLHDLTIKKLTKRLNLGKTANVVMDQFVARNAYYAYFEKISITPYEITKFETKAENKYLAVAAASIIARIFFLKQIVVLSKRVHISLLLGASNPKIIEQARTIYRDGGVKKLSQFAKIDFATTKKVV